MTIEELRKLDAAATPGPWVDAGWGIKSGNGACIVDDPGIMDANAALIAAARNALPALLAVAEAAKRMEAAYNEQATADLHIAARDVSAALAALEVSK